jgi:integrase/recombinase XerD
MNHRPPDTDKLWPWVRWFLEVYLPRHRGASAHTIDSYRTAFRMLLRFVRQRKNTCGAGELLLRHLEPAILLEFLGWLESARGRRVGAATRNCRLAALRSFFRFLQLYRGTTDGAHWERLRHLPFKRSAKPVTDHLEPPELESLFAEIPIHTADGSRDLALVALLYNTGARAAEIAAARCSGLTLGELPAIRLLGKGRKERVCPLWRSLALLLRRYIDEHRRAPKPGHEDFVFINQRGAHLTRFGVARIVGKYLRLAAKAAPSLRGRKLSVHSLRHTTAIHLLEHGADINVIKAWLGHASTLTTSRYLDLTLEKYRELLERFQPPQALDGAARASTPSVDPGADIGAWLERLS